MKVFFYFSLLLYFFRFNYGMSPCFEYGCEDCDSQAYGHCNKCRDGFRLVDGTCPCQDPSCALCTTGLAGLHICLLCKNGYYNSDNDCYCEIDNCEICQENKCQKCKSGYHYIESNNTCIKYEESEMNCFDPNCDGCYSNEQGACEYCKEGYYEVKGECIQLSEPDSFGHCEEDYYLNDGYCQQKCDGIDCPSKQFYYYTCPSNKCLVCSNNELQIFSECDNHEECGNSSCLNCITENHCVICTLGYYLLNGECKRCTDGCAICSNDNECDYCLSGFYLDSNKKCYMSDNNFDFNINKYKQLRNERIRSKFPGESTINDIDYSEILNCDPNCVNCYQNTGICKQCKSLFVLENNQCVKHCTDINCLDCSMINGNERCSECQEGYYLKNGKCYYKCSDPHCLYCSLQDEIEVCDQCNFEYKLDESKQHCKAKINYISLVFTLIGFLVIIISIITFFVYKKKRSEYRRQLQALRAQNPNYQGDSNMVNIYYRDRESERPIEVTKEQIGEEFETIKRKTEKGSQMCQYCKKKAGKYKCDCGCVVCKEHSSLKEMEGDGENYKVCYACGKIVKKVSPIKYNCHICMESRMTVVHFKCGCAIEVCKDCYIKCKLNSNKCPGCRAVI